MQRMHNTLNSVHCAHQHENKRAMPKQPCAAPEGAGQRQVCRFMSGDAYSFLGQKMVIVLLQPIPFLYDHETHFGAEYVVRGRVWVLH